MPGFVKGYPDKETADEAARRSAASRAAGVPTPAVLGRSGPTALCFEMLAGQTGDVAERDTLASLLAVLARLHRAPVSSLRPYDPFLRIRPRLGVPTRLPVARLLCEPVPTGRATLHGDLHVGQFISTAEDGVWVVDLDDLAIGPPEADLANFAAHLATSQPHSSIADWADRVCRVWVQIGEAADREVFNRFLRFALLRRHLKLREAGRPDFEAEIRAYLRDSSNFSIL